MEYKILSTKWRSALHTVGFVAYATKNPMNLGEWNAVVGCVPSLFISSEKDDAQYIAASGAKLMWREAEAIFPELDIKKFKYYPENRE